MRRGQACIASGGFSLIEVMVALVILAVITVKVLGVMSSQEQTYYAQKRALESQTDARLIADLMLRDVRAAGFMVPQTLGISSRDGGTVAADALCTSEPLAISEDFLDGASERLAGAPFSADLGPGTSVQIADADKDIDGDGTDDFVLGGGIILSDGTRTHCARIETLGSGAIGYLPATPSGFTIPAANGRAVPAIVYELTGTGLTRNDLLVSRSIEDFQVEFGVDTSGNGVLAAGPFPSGEYPVHDLNDSGTDDIQLVRLSVLARSATEDAELQTPGRPAVANRSASGTPEAFRRRLVTVATSPRNLQ